MNRLTEWIGEICIAKKRVNGKAIFNRDIFNKLAEYEDIGLEPHEIQTLLGRLEKYEWKYGSAERAMDYAEYAGNI